MNRNLAILIVAAFAAFAAPAVAQPGSMHLSYNVRFNYLFDNREFDASDEKYTESETYFAAQLLPQIGILFTDASGTSHSIVAGVSILRDMGSGKKPSGSFDDLSLWYGAQHSFGRGRNLEASAGIFPRLMSDDGLYSNAIWSDVLRFYDSHFEGLLMKYSAPCFYAELGCDWLGKKTDTTRERFQIFSAGKWNLLDWIQAGWSASFYHYATSGVASNVIDNHLINPWLQFSVPGRVDLSLKAGLLAGYQRARDIDERPHIPVGSEIAFRAGWKSLGVKNSAYFGDDQNIYYDYPAPEGGIYGANLYRGDNWYRDFYDRVDLSWNPRIGKKTRLLMMASFHFDRDGYLGCRQVVGFKTDF